MSADNEFNFSKSSRCPKTSLRRLLLSVVVGIACIALTGSVATGVWITIAVLSRNNEDAKVLQDRIEITIVLNRQLAALMELDFWRSKGCDQESLKIITADEEVFRKKAEELERRIKTRFGERGKLGPAQSAKHDALVAGTKSIVAETLANHHRALMLELQAKKAKISVEVHAEMPLPPGKIFDRTTALGEIEAQEYRLRQAAEDKMLLANRYIEAAERFDKAAVAITAKWIKKAHDEISVSIAELELACTNGALSKQQTK